MPSPWWSYALASIGLLGLWKAGSGKKSGWLIGAGAQALWIAYALATRQWGFIATALAYSCVYLRGAMRCKEDTPDE